LCASPLDFRPPPSPSTRPVLRLAAILRAMITTANTPPPHQQLRWRPLLPTSLLRAGRTVIDHPARITRPPFVSWHEFYMLMSSRSCMPRPDTHAAIGRPRHRAHTGVVQVRRQLFYDLHTNAVIFTDPRRILISPSRATCAAAPSNAAPATWVAASSDPTPVTRTAAGDTRDVRRL
jgi:hypothetical protein